MWIRAASSNRDKWVDSPVPRTIWKIVLLPAPRRHHGTRPLELPRRLPDQERLIGHFEQVEMRTERLGRVEEAHASYNRALELTRQAPERRFIEKRIAELS